MDRDGPAPDGNADDALRSEVDRISSDLLDGTLPSADAPASTAAMVSRVDSIDRAMFVAGTLDDIAAPLPNQAGSPPPPAGALLPSSPDAARAYFVLSTLDDIAAPLPNQAGPPQPGAPADVAAQADANAQLAVDTVVSTITQTPLDRSGPLAQVSVDGLHTVAGMTTHAPGALAAGSGAGGGRALAVAGMAVVALAAFIGALLALQGGVAPGTSADPAALAQAAAASPVEPSPVDSSPVGPSPVATSDRPTPEPTDSPSPTPTLEPTTVPSLTSGNVTIRGPIDASEFSATATSMRVGAHEAVLAFDPGGGPVSGTFTIEIKEFPIGLLLTSTFKGEKDADFAEFKKCSVTLTLVGKVKGTYAAETGKLSGKAAFRAQTDDIDDCLKTRPSNLSIDPDKVAAPTTVKWRAKFNGTRATGSLGLEPVMDFSATVED